MTASEETAARPQRRVGTFTLGIVLVAAGCGSAGLTLLGDGREVKSEAKRA